MLSRSLRTVAVSLLVLGASTVAVSTATAQETTTTVAAAAPVADTTPAADAAATPAGGVAAGGGFLSNDKGSNTLPVALAGAAVLAGAGIVVLRRKKA